MEKKHLYEIVKSVKSSVLIINYLTNYLENNINRIIDDYELDTERMGDDEVPHIVGYKFTLNNIIKVTINFFDECSESGIGIEEIDVDLTDFMNWLDENY